MEISSPPKISQEEEKACLPRDVDLQEARLFFQRANFKVKFPDLKPTAHAEYQFQVILPLQWCRILCEEPYCTAVLAA